MAQYRNLGFYSLIPYPFVLPRNLLVKIYLRSKSTRQRPSHSVPDSLTVFLLSEPPTVGYSLRLSRRSIACSVGACLLSTAYLPPARALEDVFQGITFAKEWPYDKSDFDRFDDADDSLFYSFPRFVFHIDDSAKQSLQRYYERKAILPSTRSILDLCSSWTSMFPSGFDKQERRVAGLGMNEEELARNACLTEYVVRDLNKTPALPYEDQSFDLVCCALSIDYLTQPLQVFREVSRVLKPGGLVTIAFSNRVFPDKAVSLWMDTGDEQHAIYVGTILSCAGGFDRPTFLDISPRSFLGSKSDPMYIVQARKV
eukprot:CAMPEP_0184337962 /NCGR_PEP_ID=MMETSP1089-20130417/6466_1 /TAXON_ID=38269 ORGANISM="Gloeochaete wittrockiana, Strain SAG46.84" /NCGR_SAMPLE_ID=MMETSP1089 /ASSEMBLY_ACC=CAM_ASM_000445 /LENGTH=312 /DNA_ID=CAMNT_0026664143 /DNA_START=76 /DNA_END=1014 /DNA_ORIENTATION=-